jgi:site-specific recombinase XerD
MATCKSFFKFLVIESYVEINPADRVSLPKTPKKPPSALSQDEIRQLINAPVPDERDYLRNKAILLLMYSGGLRVSEIVSMKMEQILLERQAVRVRGKGAKDRILPLADSARKAIIDYFLEREKKLPNSIDPKAPAFITTKGEPITVRMIQYMVYKYGRTAAIPLHVHPHLIRHSIATHLIEEGCSVEAVRQTLGHEDLATTSIYLKASSKFLKDEHKKYNPSDKLSE